MGAKLREVRRRIKSVQSTKKITKAMELIAASRIVKAERRVKESRPFSERIKEVMVDLAATTERLDHPLLQQGEGPNAVVVVTADRGLAGGFNANILKLFEGLRKEDPDAVIFAVGKKALGALRFRRIETQASWSGFSESPTYEQAQDIATKLIADFESGAIGSAKLVYTEFKTLFTQRAKTIDLLPIVPTTLEGGKELSALYEFEPEPSQLLGHLLPLYVEVLIYQALLESAASEHAARRRAMSSATENAEGLITNLVRVANQARQSEITSEIADIVGGAEALK